MCLGIPAQIAEIIDAKKMLAKADIAGVKRQVNIVCVCDEKTSPQSLVGSWVLIHVGFAMTVIDEDEAAKTLELLSQLGEVREEVEAMRNTTS